MNGFLIKSENQTVECHILSSLTLLQESLNFNFLKNNIYSERDRQILQTALLEKAHNLVEILQNNKAVPIFVKEIKISSSLNQDDPMPPGLHRLNDVDVNVILLFSVTRPLTSFKVHWKLFPDPILNAMKQQGQTVRKDDYKVKVSISDEKLSSYELSTTSPSFIWKNKPSPHFNPVVQQKRTVILSSHAKNASLILACGAFFLLLFWLLTPGNLFKSSDILVLSCVILCFVFFVDWSKRTEHTYMALPEGENLEKVLLKCFADLYSASSAQSPEMLYTRLSKSTKSNFLDDSFVNLIKAKVENPEVETIVENIQILNSQLIDYNTVECEWSVKALLRHSAHLHEKEMKFRGQLQMSPEQSGWQIEQASILSIQSEANK